MRILTQFRRNLRRRKQRNNRRRIIATALQTLQPTRTVLHGPFKGMQYPKLESVGSALYPKLLGSYEYELNGIVEQIVGNQYTEIVDIGCAEGYYAVGLAMRCPSAKLFAFDTNTRAIQLCREMMKLNGIDASRYSVNGYCDSNTLENILVSERALIISDCEGYEKQLFTSSSVKKLDKHDFLIEVHDVFDINVSTHLRSVFESGYQITVIQSIDDIFKARDYNFSELNNFNLETRKVLLAEGREAIMEWFYITRKEVVNTPTLKKERIT
ncbi:MAG TPA: methyltransferase domain-containing protein [Planctomycetes bacterium]|nr:methyltransferase domain-containing protein [Planctomycetota bacterium]